MATSPLDIELGKYWALLSSEQKKYLLVFIKSFVPATNKESFLLIEPEADYEPAGFNLEKIIATLSEQQKESLLGLLESFGVEEPDKRISLEQYNKEIDEAEAEFERGEFLSHEEVIELSKKWIHGNK